MNNYRLEIGIFHATVDSGHRVDGPTHATFTFYKFTPEDVSSKQIHSDGKVLFDAVKWCSFSLPHDELANRVAPLAVALVANGHEIGRAVVQLPVSHVAAGVLQRNTVPLVDSRTGSTVGRFDLGYSLRLVSSDGVYSGAGGSAHAASSSVLKGTIGEKLQFDVCYQLKSCCEYVVCVLKKEHSKLNVKIDAAAQSCFTRLARAVRKIVRDLNITNQLTLGLRKHAIDTVTEHQPTTLPEAAAGTVAKTLQFDVLYQLQGAVALLGGILAAPHELAIPLAGASEELKHIVSRLAHAAGNVVREVNVLVQSTLDNTLKLLKKKIDEDYSSDSSSSSSSSSDDDGPFGKTATPAKTADPQASVPAAPSSAPPPPPPPPQQPAQTVVEDLTSAPKPATA